MGIKINCIFIKGVDQCKNSNINRSWFGLGARLCNQYPYCEGTHCQYQVPFPKPRATPPPPPKRKPF